MTPPETSDQGNMVSQREGEWVLVPREASGAMEVAGAEMMGETEGFTPAQQCALIWEAMRSAAPPAEPRADEGGVSQSQPVFGSVPLPTREAEPSGLAHTPGPWHVNPKSAEESFFEDVAILRHDGMAVGVAVHNGDIQPPTVAANARLIAAAPDLLEALRQIAYLRPGGPTTNKLAMAMERIAIDALRAGGEAP